MLIQPGIYTLQLCMLLKTLSQFSGLALKGNKQSPSRSVAAYYTTG